MKLNEFNELLKPLNLCCDELKFEKIETYINYLIDYNKNVNLTAIKNREEIYIKHFYDSLTITSSIDLNKIKTVLDVGSGAGFPGIVLKIFYPNLKITLVDSNNKKTTFLQKTIELLELENIEVINARIEDYVKERINFYDLVTARAVANLRVLSEISIPLVKKDGYFIALKGNANQEIKDAKGTIEKMNCQIKSINNLQLPMNYGNRTIIIIIKFENSSLEKLRPYNKILKSCLK